MFSLSRIVSAQIVICDTMPINYNPTTIAFSTASSSFGDSVLTIDITNNSNTNFAYPLAKMVPVGMWPAGMSLTTGSQGWNVFGSSWNTGQTNACPFFF
ncbi:MAG TPA: hypothetical protein VJI69_09125, partial [Bacteroidia bacterium]|nr:hypothetical protein [Bacteroidia bacterium]